MGSALTYTNKPENITHHAKRKPTTTFATCKFFDQMSVTNLMKLPKKLTKRATIRRLVKAPAAVEVLPAKLIEKAAGTQQTAVPATKKKLSLIKQ
mmetsp:Transcript_7348/g.13556  ORF Transcript_7348/g.13556 Transcript_7348/m.13556 type:complete len:95 (-) Transcript_7348:117-401(-)